jgi:hypothetical protein
MNQYKSVIIASKASPAENPPVLTMAMILRHIVRKVIIVTPSCEEKVRDILAAADIEVRIFNGSGDSKGLINKTRTWRNFCSTTLNVLDEAGSDALLWVSGGDAALALGRNTQKYPFVLQLHELYDEHPLYRFLLAYPARRAGAVVVPEHCRAAIVRKWYHLSQTPYVMPNKPYKHPRQSNLPVTDKKASEALAELGKDMKIVLYQGHISRIRDVRPVAAAVNRLGGKWRFVIMGPDPHGFVDCVREVCPSLIYIAFVPAPFHLEITSHAHIGITVYDNSCLNNIFCAPNKIWEYAGFGIPMICSDLPGLRFTVQAAGAGKCSLLTDVDEVMECLNDIDKEYENYSSNSLRFYESANLDCQVHDIVQSIRDKDRKKSSYVCN